MESPISYANTITNYDTELSLYSKKKKLLNTEDNEVNVNSLGAIPAVQQPTTNPLLNEDRNDSYSLQQKRQCGASCNTQASTPKSDKMNEEDPAFNSWNYWKTPLPPVEEEDPAFNSWNYWKTPLPSLDDIEGVEMEDTV